MRDGAFHVRAASRADCVKKEWPNYAAITVLGNRAGRLEQVSWTGCCGGGVGGGVGANVRRTALELLEESWWPDAWTVGCKGCKRDNLNMRGT